MASALRSSFVGGVSLYSISKAVEPRHTGSRLHLRVVSERSSSDAMPGSESKLMRPDGGEVSRILGTGIEKQGELWWAPLFGVSADEQWANLLTKEATEKGAEQGMVASRRLAPVRTTAIALPDVGNSQPNGSKPNSSRGVFTAEKARALRKSMRASETWHDGWYHSAIASRLAEQID